METNPIHTLKHIYTTHHVHMRVEKGNATNREIEQGIEQWSRAKTRDG